MSLIIIKLNIKMNLLLKVSLNFRIIGVMKGIIAHINLRIFHFFQTSHIHNICIWIILLAKIVNF